MAKTGGSTPAISATWTHTDRPLSSAGNGYIVRGGLNIVSAEVDNALIQHAEVLEAAVVAVPHAIGSARSQRGCHLAAPVTVLCTQGQGSVEHRLGLRRREVVVRHELGEHVMLAGFGTSELVQWIVR